MKKNKIIKLKNINIGGSYPLIFILGPCQIESRDHSLMMAEKISKICFELNADFIFKSSFEKLIDLLFGQKEVWV